jgi:hypothetical protein
MSKTKIAIIGEVSQQQMDDLLAMLPDDISIVHVASLDDLPRDRADDYVCYSNQSNLSPYAPDKLIEFAKVKIHEPAPTPKNRQERKAQAAQRTKKKH